jgi:hypothetical protein
MRRLLTVVLLVLLASCTPPARETVQPQSTTQATVTTTTVVASGTFATPPTTSAPPRSALADAVIPIGSARYRRPGVSEAVPTGLTIEAIDVVAAPIIPVGVLPDGSMEIPAASEVGWYRFGARPGDTGSSVLAAHIAFNGEPGVFVELGLLQVGDSLTVTFEDGEVRRFEVTETARYPKDELPARRLFGGDGGELALVTCGGEFDASSRSYADNVVVYAVASG